MTYAENWRLACALKQPYPAIRETGDVEPNAPSLSSSSGLSFSPSEVKLAFENMSRAARVLLAVGTGIGLVLGGAVGYAIGKAK